MLPKSGIIKAEMEPNGSKIFFDKGKKGMILVCEKKEKSWGDGKIFKEDSVGQYLYIL